MQLSKHMNAAILMAIFTLSCSGLFSQSVSGTKPAGFPDSKSANFEQEKAEWIKQHPAEYQKMNPAAVAPAQTVARQNAPHPTQIDVPAGFPVMKNSGNPEKDAAEYATKKKAWTEAHPDAQPANSFPVSSKSATTPPGYPVFHSTGNPEKDLATYQAEKADWIKNNPEAYKNWIKSQKPAVESAEMKKAREERAKASGK